MSTQVDALITALNQYLAQQRTLFDVLPQLTSIVAALKLANANLEARIAAVEQGSVAPPDTGGGTGTGGGNQPPDPLPLQSTLTAGQALPVVQSIFGTYIHWYAGNDPNSAAMQAWAALASSGYFNGTHTYADAYELLRLYIINDSRNYDPTIPVNGWPPGAGSGTGTGGTGNTGNGGTAPSTTALVTRSSAGYLITSDDFKRMYGPGAVRQDGLWDQNVLGTKQVTNRFRCPYSGPIAKTWHYFADNGGSGNGGGYAMGNGGIVSFQLWPDDGTGKPNTTGSPMATATYTPSGMTNGTYATPANRFSSVTWTSSVNMQAGQVYHVMARNTHGSPTTNWSCLDQFWTLIGNGRPLAWGNAMDWGCMTRPDTSTAWDDWTTNGHSGAYVVPNMAVQMGDGTTFGFSGLESGNLVADNAEGTGPTHQRLFSNAAANPIREFFQSVNAHSFTGFSFNTCKKSGTGGLHWQIEDQTANTIMAQGTIPDPGNNYATDSTTGNQTVLDAWYDVAFSGQIVTFDATKPYTIRFDPLGSSVWAFGAQHTFKTRGWPSSSYWNESFAQWYSGTWKAVNFFYPSTDNPDQNGNWRVVFHQAPAGSGGSSGGGGTTPTDPTPVTPGNAVNTLSLVISDISTPSDSLRIKGLPTSYAFADGPRGPGSEMGRYPRVRVPDGADGGKGTKILEWDGWYSFVADQSYNDSDLWTAIYPWNEIAEGADGNGVNLNKPVYDNIATETRDHRLYFRKASNKQWFSIGVTPWMYYGKMDVSGGNYGLWTGVVDDADIRYTANSVIIRYRTNAGFLQHGVWSQYHIDVSQYLSDFDCLFTTYQRRLVKWNDAGAWDPQNSFIVDHAGADWYPFVGADPAQCWPPGVGRSRFKRIAEGNFVPVSYAPVYLPGHDYAGLKPGLVLCDEQSFRSYPPPLV